jgi:ribonuclease Z
MKRSSSVIVYVIVAVVAGIGVLAAILYNTAAGQDALFRRAANMLMGQAPAPLDGMRVVVCGSASPLGNDPDRAQACIAVITPEHFFLFDVGARSPLRMAQARLPMNRLNAVFLTHFHSDHIASLPDVNLTTWVQGRKTNLEVYGPPGIRIVIDGFNQAYRLDRGYRTAHHGSDLLPPATGSMEAVEFRPGEIAWRDDLLTITSFGVDHAPISPAVGYRVDYRGRSVVISGDTNATDTLFAVAKGADLLLHDALSRTLLDPMITVATQRNMPVMPRIMSDVIDYHADANSLEARALDAGIAQLALYHLVPTPTNALTEKMFARGLAPETLLVRDLHTFDLPANSTELRISEP